MKDSYGDRDLPISLQGLGRILAFLASHAKETFSMRGISDETGVSMRVVKNALVQLERLGHVEPVTRADHVLPRWKATRSGAKAGKGLDPGDGADESILDGLAFAGDAADLARRSREARVRAVATTRGAVVAATRLQRDAGNAPDPAAGEVARFVLARVKALHRRVSALPGDPLAVHVLRKAGEARVELSKQEETYFFTEVHFFSALLERQAGRLAASLDGAREQVAGGAAGDVMDAVHLCREEARRLTRVVHHLEGVKPRAGTLTAARLAELAGDHVDPALVREVLDAGQGGVVATGTVRRFVLGVAGRVQSGNAGDGEPARPPLVAFWNRLLDEEPGVSISIEDFERTINAMADEGLLPGIATIEVDGGRSLKVVDFTGTDMSAAEVNVTRHAVRLGAFTMADMVAAAALDATTVASILDGLVDQGVLGHSRSYVHGDRWHVRSTAGASGGPGKDGGGKA